MAILALISRVHLASFVIMLFIYLLQIRKFSQFIMILHELTQLLRFIPNRKSESRSKDEKVLRKSHNTHTMLLLQTEFLN
jgi:hypothetical protein